MEYVFRSRLSLPDSLPSANPSNEGSGNEIESFLEAYITVTDESETELEEGSMTESTSSLRYSSSPFRLIA